MKNGEFTSSVTLHPTHEEDYRSYMREKVSPEDDLLVPPFAHVLRGTHNFWVEVWHKVTEVELEAWRAQSKGHSRDPRMRDALAVLRENYREAVERLQALPEADALCVKAVETELGQDKY